MLAVQIALTSAIAAAAAAMLMVFVWEFTLGVFMTEVAGFVLGALALSLLLAFSESKHPLQLFAGVAFLSMAMVSRLGAVFVMPAAPLWVAIRFSGDGQLRRYLSLGIAGAAVGPVLQFAAVWLLGLDPTNTGGNFSTTLYGMSTGSRRWTEAHEHFRAVFDTQPEIAAFKVVYAAAIQNILDRPEVFIQLLAAAFGDYWRMFFAVGAFGRWSSALSALFVMGLVRAAVFFRRSLSNSLLLMLLLGEVATAPLIGDAGVRVFAASIGSFDDAVAAPAVQSLCATAERAANRALRSRPLRSCFENWKRGPHDHDHRS